MLQIIAHYNLQSCIYIMSHDLEAFVAAVILVYFAGNLPNFKEASCYSPIPGPGELQFCEYFAGVGNVWRAVSRIQMLLVDAPSSGLLKPKEEIPCDAAPISELATLPVEGQTGDEGAHKRLQPETHEKLSPEKKVQKSGEVESALTVAALDEKLKRPAPAREEKVSPEAKVAKAAQVQEEVDSQPTVKRNLFVDTPAESQAEAPKEPAPTPAPVPTPVRAPALEALETAAKDVSAQPSEPVTESQNALLLVAMQRITELEAKLKQQEEKQTKMTSFETPPPKTLHSMTPSSTTSAKTASAPDSQAVHMLSAGDETSEKNDTETNEDGAKAEEGKDLLEFPNGSKLMSHDALRMRLRRLCQKTKKGKSHVDEDTQSAYEKGGEEREWLEIALIEAISKAEFRSRVILVRERMTSKEQEILGQWMTREKMEKSGDFSPAWKYDASVPEYFVETSTKQTIRQTELLKRQEAVDATDDASQHYEPLQTKDNQPVEPIKVATMKAITEEGLSPVLPELVKFMDAIHNKMMAVQSNLGKLEIEGDGATNPMTKELMKDWENVRLNLKAVFSSLAELKADIMLDEGSTSEKFLCLQPYGA
ncbi:unnamed protein product [Durusdinium trenchii]|uniref:Uncharacterized protein n=1 Tax=Durusdinium trenchii TaxID=1381693 RepID=A0ABP0N4C3_9DINO